MSQKGLWKFDPSKYFAAPGSKEEEPKGRPPLLRAKSTTDLGRPLPSAVRFDPSDYFGATARPLGEKREEDSKPAPVSSRHHGRSRRSRRRVLDWPPPAFLDSTNPFVGTFAHAPSGQRAPWRYLRRCVMTSAEYVRHRSVRHNPHIGTFHSTPGVCSTLHQFNIAAAERVARATGRPLRPSAGHSGASNPSAGSSIVTMGRGEGAMAVFRLSDENSAPPPLAARPRQSSVPLLRMRDPGSQSELLAKVLTSDARDSPPSVALERTHSAVNIMAAAESPPLMRVRAHSASRLLDPESPPLRPVEARREVGATARAELEADAKIAAATAAADLWTARMLRSGSNAPAVWTQQGFGMGGPSGTRKKEAEGKGMEEEEEDSKSLEGRAKKQTMVLETFPSDAQHAVVGSVRMIEENIGGIAASTDTFRNNVPDLRKARTLSHAKGARWGSPLARDTSSKDEEEELGGGGSQKGQSSGGVGKKGQSSGGVGVGKKDQSSGGVGVGKKDQSFEKEDSSTSKLEEAGGLWHHSSGAAPPSRPVVTPVTSRHSHRSQRSRAHMHDDLGAAVATLVPTGERRSSATFGNFSTERRRFFPWESQDKVGVDGPKFLAALRRHLDDRRHRVPVQFSYYTAGGGDERFAGLAFSRDGRRGRYVSVAGSSLAKRIEQPGFLGSARHEPPDIRSVIEPDLALLPPVLAPASEPLPSSPDLSPSPSVGESSGSEDEAAPAIPHSVTHGSSSTAHRIDEEDNEDDDDDEDDDEDHHHTKVPKKSSHRSSSSPSTASTETESDEEDAQNALKTPTAAESDSSEEDIEGAEGAIWYERQITPVNQPLTHGLPSRGSVASALVALTGEVEQSSGQSSRAPLFGALHSPFLAGNDEFARSVSSIDDSSGARMSISVAVVERYPFAKSRGGSRKGSDLHRGRLGQPMRKGGDAAFPAASLAPATSGGSGSSSHRHYHDRRRTASVDAPPSFRETPPSPKHHSRERRSASRSSSRSSKSRKSPRSPAKTTPTSPPSPGTNPLLPDELSVLPPPLRRARSMGPDALRATSVFEDIHPSKPGEEEASEDPSEKSAVLHPHHHHHHRPSRDRTAPLIGIDLMGRFRDISREFELERTVASGGYASVRMAKHRKTKYSCVVKCIRKSWLGSEVEVMCVKREADIMAQLRHPNIVALLDAFEDDSYAYLVMEHVSGGDLQNFFNRQRAKMAKERSRRKAAGKPPPAGRTRAGVLSERQVRRIAQQLLDALSYMHEERGLLHGDIKPENILLSTETLRSFGVDSASGALGVYDVVKLCDFGHARLSRDAKYYHRTGSVSLVPFEDIAGTQGYIAPEILERRPYTVAIDMWALGVVLFECLGGYLPFRPPSRCVTVDVSFPLPDWNGVSDDAKDFLAGLLERDPRRRLTVEDARNHSWIRTEES